MEPLECVIFGCVIGIGGPNFAEQQLLFDAGSTPESSASLSATEGERQVYDGPPDASSPYAPLSRQRSLYDARPGSSSEQGPALLYPDALEKQGKTREYSGGRTGYQFGRPLPTFPKERD